MPQNQEANRPEPENFSDIEIKCKECGQWFFWTAGERRFYAKKRLSRPVRCQECREKKRQAGKGGRTVKYD